uniref:X antigen family member 2-like n=1 Tax=Odobenus rosmarus divergens TaxID=9708 RepID=UPI00063CE3D5|nr:PREDICTED: X antigen family member 2-like [Odobenus rosmarus divergens]
MSARVRPRSRTRIKERKDNPGSKRQEQQPSDEEPRKKEALPESQDILPDQGKEVEAGPVAQGPEMKADLRKLVQSKTGDKSEDAPNMKGASLPSVEFIKMPEAGSHHQGALEMEQEESLEVPLRGTEVGPSSPGGTIREGASDFGTIHCVGDTTEGLHQPRFPAEALIAPPSPSRPLHSILLAHLSPSGHPV